MCATLGFFPAACLQSKAQKVHVRRRVYDPQRAIDVEGIHSRHAVEALRQHALEDISRSDVLLGLLD